MGKIKQEELNNVDGGAGGSDNYISCPNCGKFFYGPESVVTHGSGCSKKAYWKCPECGYEWE